MGKPRGGSRTGAGRKALPLFARVVKRSVTLPVDVDAWVTLERRAGEPYSKTLTRLLSEHPRFAPDTAKL